MLQIIKSCRNCGRIARCTLVEFCKEKLWIKDTIEDYLKMISWRK